MTQVQNIIQLMFFLEKMIIRIKKAFIQMQFLKEIFKRRSRKADTPYY